MEKLVDWRGDDENGKTVLEDVFREVIVISDDEDSDDESQSELRSRRDSTEVVSNIAQPHQVELRTLNFADPNTIDQDERRYLAGDEPPPGYRFVARPSRRVVDPQRLQRTGLIRHQIWDRARNNYLNRQQPERQTATHQYIVAAQPNNAEYVMPRIYRNRDDRISDFVEAPSQPRESINIPVRGLQEHIPAVSRACETSQVCLRSHAGESPTQRLFSHLFSYVADTSSITILWCAEPKHLQNMSIRHCIGLIESIQAPEK